MTRFAVSILCFAVFCVFPVMAKADLLTDGQQAEDRGDYVTAFNDYAALAAHGDKSGEVNVARLYLTGKGVAQSCTLALHWYALAARQGVVQAIHNFGVFNANGICMPRNYANAAKIFAVLSDHGVPKDESSLANLYDHGWGVPQDFGQAARSFTLAANQNDANAQGNLGILYKAGQGEPQDNVQAYKWLTISINNNSDPAGDSFRASMKMYLMQQRDLLAHQMTKAEIAHAQAMAANWQAGSR